MEKRENDDVVVKELVNIYASSIRSYQSQINMIKSSIKYYEDIRNSYYDQEPLKIFKAKHNSWKDKITEIDAKLMKFYNQLEVVYDDYVALIHIKKKNKRV